MESVSQLFGYQKNNNPTERIITIFEVSKTVPLQRREVGVQVDLPNKREIMLL